MSQSNILREYQNNPLIDRVKTAITDTRQHIFIEGTTGSFKSVLMATCLGKHSYLAVMNDKEEAAYFYNDLVQLIGEENVYFLPSTYKRSPEYGNLESSNIILRTEALNYLANTKKPGIVVSYPLAFFEKVPNNTQLKDATLNIKNGEQLDISFVTEVLNEYKFERVDFVYEPGQFSVRGSIIDIYSFANEDPYRIDFFGDEVDTIRTFDLENQLSKTKLSEIAIIPNLSTANHNDNISLLDFIDTETRVWAYDIDYIVHKIKDAHTKIVHRNSQRSEDQSIPSPEMFVDGETILEQLNHKQCVEFGKKSTFKNALTITFKTTPQPAFNKNFDLLQEDLISKEEGGYRTFILADNPKQHERLSAIFEDKGSRVNYAAQNKTLHEGFIDHDLQLCFYTDHQIFERYHKFSLRTDRARIAKQAISLKEISRLNPGDYVVHVDHGIGRFGGLVTSDVNGKKQEVIRLVFKDNDVLLVSIHSLHRISKYKSKEGEPPRINKLGTAAWQKIKDKTKKKVKDIARELIALYAKRKQEPGFAFSPDSYLQTELEASFIYEDTPDQEKSSRLVKEAMEKDTPMDMLVCGDVGFGKTEIAIRAAFKAVADNKQVAVLVPTTILAMQHYKTFTERLKDFPCEIDYISRLRKPKEIKHALNRLKTGELNILIGTHRLIGKDVAFKDMGLLIIDEEQRFGVSIKEKLKKIKVNVDTLTLTATPIPRTLQFSLMGARDLSILNTPPPNRHPILTELHTINDEIIKEAISYEIDRNGQVFFIHNRVQNIYEVEAMVNRIMPTIKTVVAHGQMEGRQLEKIMLDFINGDYDVLIATTIIESGLDIPNANTIIINNANHFGLSELHQLRGRVGRSNKKAFCYLLAPPLTSVTQEARRRLKIIEEFSDLGSGFNISMQDLDLRGAGNLLGGEQSGFIADIGFETYHRILNEAILELKETEFKELYQEEINQVTDKNIQFVSDCTIETDARLLLPDDYVENVAERMQLYRKLDGLKDEEELEAYKSELTDRFGAIPSSTLELIQVVQIRWHAIDLGIEKIIFKNNKLMIHFVSNPESPYYQSPVFTGILAYLQTQAKNVKMQEKGGKLSMVFPSIDNITSVKKIFNDIHTSIFSKVNHNAD
ncbi:transcription-repair coupling factor [Saccharicrinis fermentans]|uniref:Transcription-repair-coupling factor n=1 Tax=Saccharicrinis fermentans DSM 9555 = JCM 21142 TaxID=869213 RepID=W7YLC6_9BACT|nr:transcription-repair coupling factor [Saccharicrinis fermentans]GAF05366.1 transcription-repair-coupling factor [Saccharicrinis fermentans DSM 9555 = JCM 21142]